MKIPKNLNRNGYTNGSSKIHHQYGVSEKANYEIQKLFDKAINEAIPRAKESVDYLAQREVYYR